MFRKGFISLTVFNFFFKNPRDLVTKSWNQQTILTDPYTIFRVRKDYATPTFGEEMLYPKRRRLN